MKDIEFEFREYFAQKEDLKRIENLKQKRNSLSEEFLRSEAVNESPIVSKAVHMLKNGLDIYHVFEDTMTLFYKQNKERFEIMKKLVETCGQPFNFSAGKEYTNLITEMKEAIEWYMDNCRTINDGRSYDETFYNLGMNLISRAEDLLNE